jgi:hypothetical protein
LSGNAGRVPPVLIQPIAADDFARAIAKIATGTPLIADPHARYFGTELSERSLVAGDEAQLGEIRFDDWLDRTAHPIPGPNAQPAAVTGAWSERAQLKEFEVRISEVPPGSVLLVGDIAVFNIEGGFCATQARCTHRQGPLSEGTLDARA